MTLEPGAEAQQQLAAGFGSWALPPAGLRHPRVPTGHLMSLQPVCAAVKPLPDTVIGLARAAVGPAYGEQGPEARACEPDAASVNLYPDGARLGVHQDGEEPSEAPVITVSLGDTCTFRLAGVDRGPGPFTDIDMRSGDLLMFGQENRRICHGVPKVLAGTRAGRSRAATRAAQHHRRGDGPRVTNVSRRASPPPRSPTRR